MPIEKMPEETLFFALHQDSRAAPELVAEFAANYSLARRENNRIFQIRDADAFDVKMLASCLFIVEEDAVWFDI